MPEEKYKEIDDAKEKEIDMEISEAAKRVPPESADLSKDPLERIAADQRKTLFFTRIIGFSALVMAIAVVIACVIIIPKAIYTLAKVNNLIEEGSTTLENANATLSNIDSMSAEIQTAADGINKLVDNNSEVLQESVAKLNNIDFESLNEAIKDLSDVVEPMADFF